MNALPDCSLRPPLFQSLFSWCICVCMWMCVFAYMHVEGRGKSQVFHETGLHSGMLLDTGIINIFWDMISVGLELISQIMLPNQWVPKTYLALLPWQWNYSMSLQTWHFHMGSGYWTQSACLQSKSLTYKTVPLSSCTFEQLFSSVDFPKVP